MQLSVPLQAGTSKRHDLKSQSTGSHHSVEACGSFHPYPWTTENKEHDCCFWGHGDSVLIVLNSGA